jgi:predicted Zn-dependent peptidase
VANSAAAAQNGLKYEGYFELSGVAKPGRKPEEVEQALYREIARLQAEPVPDRELQKVKNQIAASNYRRLESDFGLMYQLLAAEAGRGWKTLFSDSPRFQAVAAEDVQRVAKRYFRPESRSVLLLYRKPGARAEGGRP